MVQKFLHQQHYSVEITLHVTCLFNLKISTPWPSRDSSFTTSSLSKICQEELPVRLANRIAHLDMLPDLEDRWYGVETLRGDGVHKRLG